MLYPLEGRALARSFTLAFFIVSFACLLPAAVSRAQLTFNNGSAPPNPDNVIDEQVEETVFVVNEGCLGSRDAIDCFGTGHPTIVSLVEGASIVRTSVPLANPGLHVYGHARLEVHGAEVSRMLHGPPRGIAVRSQSSLLVSGGSIFGGLAANEASSIDVRGGWIDRSVASGDPHQVFPPTDGFPAADRIGPMVMVEGGSIGAVRAAGLSVVEVRGGEIRDSFNATDDARVFISGGAFGDPPGEPLRLSALGTSRFEIIGRDFTLDGEPIGFGEIPFVVFPEPLTISILGGILESGEAFEFEIIRPRWPATTRVFALPEPTPLPDRDADGVPDRRDFCPDVHDPSNRDTDLDYIGDVCNDSFDLDGDEVADDRDNCPNVVAIDQTNSDGDDLGDACDPYPDDRFNYGAIDDLGVARDEISILRFDLDRKSQDLDQCLADPPYLDEDGDGIHDRTDACRGTDSSQAVDPAGCSRSQYCRAVGLARPGDARSCQRSDWMNDELRSAPGDCKFVEDASGSRCVDASEARAN